MKEFLEMIGFFVVFFVAVIGLLCIITVTRNIFLEKDEWSCKKFEVQKDNPNKMECVNYIKKVK